MTKCANPKCDDGFVYTSGTDVGYPCRDCAKLKGTYEEIRRVTFPHDAVVMHSDHLVVFEMPETGTLTSRGSQSVRCDGTVVGVGDRVVRRLSR